MSDRDECLPPSPDRSGASADVICTCNELERLRQERDRAIKDLEILQIGFGPRWIQTLKRQLALSRAHYRQVLDRVQRNSAARIEHLRRQVLALTEAANQQSASDPRLWNSREDGLERAAVMESDLRKELAEELTLRRRANARAEAAEYALKQQREDAALNWAEVNSFLKQQRERTEAAEAKLEDGWAAAAAMRKGLLDIWTVLRDSESDPAHLIAERERLLQIMHEALSYYAGRDLLARMERYERALRDIKLNRQKTHTTPYPCHDDAWWLASEALEGKPNE